MGIPHLKPKRTGEYFSSTERKELSTTVYLVKISFSIKGEIKTFSDEEKQENHP